ncbi:hypothetical protein QQ045_008517 [Rhodiola kirilowii]
MAGFFLQVQAETHGMEVSNSCYIIHPRMTVYIKHRMGQGVVVDLHCKSKDDDLGVQHLAQEQQYSFSFLPNIWGTTQFWCDVSWNGRKQVFDAYRNKVQFWRCYDMACDCPWLLTPNGPCFYDLQTKQFDRCQSWKG